MCVPYSTSAPSSFIKSLVKNRGLRNVSYLTLGSAISQIISLIGAFYIPKILGPNDYGIYQTVLSYIGMFTVFTFSGINKVVLRECSRNLNDAKVIFESTIGIRNLFSVLASLISMVVVLFIDYKTGTKIFVAIYSLSLLMAGLRSSFGVIYQANERMEYIAVFNIARTTIAVSLSILFVSLGYGVLSLILIQLLTGITVLSINYRISKKFLDFNILSKIRFHKKFIKQGFSFSLLDFLTMLSGKIDLLMISILGTPAQVGIYALAYNLVEKGLIIRQSVAQSFFPIYTKKFEQGEMQSKTLFSHTLLLAFPSLAIALLAPLISEQVITFIVSDKYIDSVQIFNVLIFYLVLSYAIVPFGLALQTTNSEMILVNIGIIKAVLNIGLNIWFFKLYGLIGIAYSTLVCFGFNTFLQTIFGFRKVQQLNIK